jgi:cell division protein FtsL
MSSPAGAQSKRFSGRNRSPHTRVSSAVRPSPSRADLRIVRRKRRGLIQRSSSRRATPLVIGGVIMVALLIATVLLEQVLMAQSAFKLGEIRQRTERAEAQQQELVLQVTQLENHERIEAFARTQLGMVETNVAGSEYMVADIELGSDSKIAKGQKPEDLELAGTAAAYVTGQEETP